MRWYHCQNCGCYLDPGEGDLCDECKRARKEGKMWRTRIERKAKEPRKYTRT